MLTDKEIRKLHDGYTEYSQRWDYYHRSYVGGEEYKQGHYLRMYLNESAAPGDQYGQRITNTALQNHVKSVVHIYRSYLFRNYPTRTLGNLINLPEVQAFVTDVDRNGTDFDAFMKSLADNLMVYGGGWIVVDKPSYRAENAQQELELGITAYASMYTPPNVLDWHYEPDISGRNRLVYLKLVEHSGKDRDHIVVWYEDKIERYIVEKTTTDRYANDTYGADSAQTDIVSYGKITGYEEHENPLGYVPAFCVITDPSGHNGIGNSQIADIADTQRSIYNRLSELEQAIRISGHPTLVKTPDTKAAAGAGAIINIPEDLDPGLFPQLLQPAATTVDGIIKAIEMDVDAIDTMSHTKGIRGSVGTPMSGVALQTEMQMLNSRLSDFADVLQEAEYKIWRLWFDWQQIEPDEDFDVNYEKSFDIRDRHSDIELMRKAVELNSDPKFVRAMRKRVAQMLIDDEAELTEVLDGPVVDAGMTHPPVTSHTDLIVHMREMIDAGYTNEQINQLHPELQQLFATPEVATE